MKILVLGGTGMVGYNLFMAWKSSYDTKVTCRNDSSFYKNNKFFSQESCFFNVDINCLDSLKETISNFSPDAVVNAIGITKQLTLALPLDVTNYINAIFPHHLAELCEAHEIRLIHLSSDCVFSGKQGRYTENDEPDAEDLYGQSKAKGEVSAEHVLTLRKSTIGLEAGTNHGLIEWFLSQTGQIQGYSKAIYSGIITSELASVIEMILLDYPKLHGIYNVASAPISKYNLLVNLNECLQRKDLTIIPDDEIVCDRSLDGARFEEITKYKAPSWDDMIEKLACEIRERESQ